MWYQLESNWSIWDSVIAASPAGPWIHNRGWRIGRHHNFCKLYQGSSQMRMEKSGGCSALSFGTTLIIYWFKWFQMVGQGYPSINQRALTSVLDFPAFRSAIVIHGNKGPSARLQVSGLPGPSSPTDLAVSRFQRTSHNPPHSSTHRRCGSWSLQKFCSNSEEPGRSETARAKWYPELQWLVWQIWWLDFALFLWIVVLKSYCSSCCSRMNAG